MPRRVEKPPLPPHSNSYLVDIYSGKIKLIPINLTLKCLNKSLWQKNLVCIGIFFYIHFYFIFYQKNWIWLLTIVLVISSTFSLRNVVLIIRIFPRMMANLIGDNYQQIRMCSVLR